ncbi:MAG TPA: sigma-54 dependent transcriptional regulator [Candidatus Polarisedimenticolia bacterium]|nr:sigma-54 dependent transcriptional regulator [Candidatus Polarisedimenticolia bacterium]
MADPLARLLIIEDDQFLRKQIAAHFSGRYEILQAENREEGLALLRGGGVDLVLLDMRLPPDTDSIEEGLKSVSEIYRLSPGTLTIAMSGDGDRETVIRTAQAGVYDFFTKPLDIRELEIIIRRALDRRRLDLEVRRLREELTRRYDFKSLKGASPAMQGVKNSIRKVSDSNATIMIRGESGTGKELVARAVHFNSPRRDARFVALNCSAFPEHLVEDELFGHEKGAFTGAVGLRQGRFELADGGTLFLDEVGTLTPAVQAKLLRVLESREFERLGGKDTVHVDIRLVTATNQDLEKDVTEGRFRQDLYYRINVVTIQLPPLRERTDDIQLLAEHFFERFCRENNVSRKRFSEDALACLVAHEWKGNVRELEHLVESLVLLSEQEVITARDLPADVRQRAASGSLPSVSLPEGGILLEKHVAEFERRLLANALERASGRKKDAAVLLGLNKDQMKYLCRKYNL